MDYKLAKQLKEVGMKWNTLDLFDMKGNEIQAENYPTFEELIDECGEGLNALLNKGGVWVADGGKVIGGFYGNEFCIEAKTPIEAVAKLYIAINK